MVDSRKQSRKLTRMSVGDLKCSVANPDLVELCDVNAPDPVFLIKLKETRNSVGVPKHWSMKRAFLQNKRGFVKAPFKLPGYIERTGISDLRNLDQEREKFANLRARSRQKARPKIGRNEIEYTKLYNAFFTWAERPSMSEYGDVYFENKENMVDYTHFKPGELSHELKVALGMISGEADGGNSQKLVPPPWLVNMQRNGPPPAFPNLRIAGLNAPIPPNCYFGYHAGGWGKPPVDQRGKPLYGDVFGAERTLIEHIDPAALTEWGAIIPSDIDELSEGSEEEDEEEEDEVNNDMEVEDEVGHVADTDYGTEDGTVGSVGVDIELRKRKAIEAEMDDSEQKTLYKILPERKTGTVATNTDNLMPSAHTYDIPPIDHDLVNPTTTKKQSSTTKDKKFDYKF